MLARVAFSIQAISKKQITFKDKARAGSAELAAGHEKAQHTREYVSILKRLATP